MKIFLRAFLLLAVVVSAGIVLAQPPQVEFEELTVEIINTYPHDPTAYTQGLVWYEGRLFESTGQRGESTLREVELETGEVLRVIPLTRPEEEMIGDNALPNYFGEGLALVDDRLIQLTWTAGEAFVYDRESFEELDRFTYDTQGWGLCYDGEYLVMSDGSSFLSIREPDSFELVVQAAVSFQGQLIGNYGTPNGRSLGRINELECVGDQVYANVYQTDFILRIDRRSGQVSGIIDASGLLSEEDLATLVDPLNDQVLNGIAYNPETDTFYITGKDWPKLFEVRFVPQVRQSR